MPENVHVALDAMGGDHGAPVVVEGAAISLERHPGTKFVMVGSQPVLAWDLRAYPMIMDELRRIAGKDDIVRPDLPASGPLIVCELIGRPWVSPKFNKRWRKIAHDAGIPDNIQNRDSRPGAATEANLAGAGREDVQR